MLTGAAGQAPVQSKVPPSDDKEPPGINRQNQYCIIFEINGYPYENRGVY